MITTIVIGLLSTGLVYKVYTSEKKAEDYIKEFDRLNKFNRELEDEIWSLRIDLQNANNQLLLSKMSHEKTKQELEDKAKTWENQYQAMKNESNSHQSND